MYVANINFIRPTVIRASSFVLHFFIASAMMFGIRHAIESGDVKNEPELLRTIMFCMFSPAICFRLCWDLGFRQNNWGGRFSMFGLLYVPIGLFFAYAVGFFSSV